LTFEGAGSAPDDSAKALAEKYVGLLGKRTGLALHPITIEEFLARTAPPVPSMNWHAQGWYGRDSRESRDRVSRAMCEARNELLASVDDTLRRVYDYRITYGRKIEMYFAARLQRNNLLNLQSKQRSLVAMADSYGKV